jgi:hypothetical protein
MAKTDREARNFWIGLIALLLVGILLGVQSERRARVLMATRPDAPVVTDSDATSQRALIADLDVKAARVKQSFAGSRDPFGDPPAPQSDEAAATPATSRTSPPPAHTPPPALRAVVYDEVNPSVQLSDGSRTSDWLHQGDVFQGWKVNKIEAHSVTVTHGGEIAVLKPS